MLCKRGCIEEILRLGCGRGGEFRLIYSSRALFAADVLGVADWWELLVLIVG